MVLLKDVLVRIGKYEDLLDDGYSIEIEDSLPDKFSELVWTTDMEDEQESYGECILFSVSFKRHNEAEEIHFYIDVKVLRDKEKFDFIIYFGELEEGTIDLDNITVNNEADYSFFLKTLLEYVDHAYNVIVKE
jgi:hypothetical protein